MLINLKEYSNASKNGQNRCTNKVYLFCLFLYKGAEVGNCKAVTKGIPREVIRKEYVLRNAMLKVTVKRIVKKNRQFKM